MLPDDEYLKDSMLNNIKNHNGYDTTSIEDTLIYITRDIVQGTGTEKAILNMQEEFYEMIYEMIHDCNISDLTFSSLWRELPYSPNHIKGIAGDITQIRFKDDSAAALFRMPSKRDIQPMNSGHIKILDWMSKNMDEEMLFHPWNEPKMHWNHIHCQIND